MVDFGWSILIYLVDLEIVIKYWTVAKFCTAEIKRLKIDENLLQKSKIMLFTLLTGLSFYKYCKAWSSMIWYLLKRQ